MKKFEVAELEVINFEEDVIASSGGCWPDGECMFDSCMCDGQWVCTQVD